MPDSVAFVFLSNHDNQRGHGGAGDVITFNDPKSDKNWLILIYFYSLILYLQFCALMIIFYWYRLTTLFLLSTLG